MTLTRTHANGHNHVAQVPDTRSARQRVAWCATDNLGMTRTDASAAAAAFAADLDEPYVLGPYTFVLTLEQP